MLKTMLNSIKTLTRYCKTTINVFFKKNFFDDDKNVYLHNKFFVKNQNSTASHVIIQTKTKVLN